MHDSLPTLFGLFILLGGLTVGCPACSEPANDGDGAALELPDGQVAADGENPADTGFLPDTPAGSSDTAAAADSVEPAGDTAKPTDGPCQKQCLGKICGPNGCGGVCGFCVSGQFCAPDGSKCQEFCKPECGAKKCGDDGCGGDCGVCGDGFACGLDLLCHAKDCKPECAAKKCGDDGCGGACGTCGAGDFCTATGTCKPGACKGIPSDGMCDGGILIGCSGTGASQQKTLKDCATTGAGKVCGWDPVSSHYGCIDKPPCTPDCSKTGSGEKKQCGSDGCDGVCGTCPAGWSCPGGDCVPEDGADCGFLPQNGKCDGSVWIFCNTGKIKKIDCAKYNQQCKWDNGAYNCL